MSGSKKPAKQSDLLVGIDFGTTKICAIVAEMTDAGGLSIIGVGMSPSRGLRKGVVVDIESTVESIKKAVEEAELMAGCDIHSVYVGVAGSHISSMNSDGVVAIKEREVTPYDIERVIDSARARAISEGQRGFTSMIRIGANVVIGAGAGAVVDTVSERLGSNRKSITSHLSI